jgi:mono/diheme cytochrome c family protein
VKKPVKVLIFSLGILLLIISATVASIYIASNARIGRSFIVTAGHIPVFKSPADLAEGERLYVSRGCGDCHGVDAGGKTFIDDPAIGRITGSNLTSGKGGVGSARSNEDFARALRHGVGQNSRALVFMPSTDFTTMTDEDAGKLISFVRTMPAVDREAPQTRIGPLARLLFLTGQMPLLVSAEKIDHNAKPQAKLSPAVTVEYGKYVAATCTGCHRDNLQGGPYSRCATRMATGAKYCRQGTRSLRRSTVHNGAAHRQETRRQRHQISHAVAEPQQVDRHRGQGLMEISANTVAASHRREPTINDNNLPRDISRTV